MTTDYETLFPANTEGDPLDLYALDREIPPGRPWVLVNFVAGLDGAVAVDGRVGALTSPADQGVFHHLRGLADVVLVGAGTVRAEGYGPVRTSATQRTARQRRGQRPVPPIAIVSGSLQLDLSSSLFADTGTRPIVICPETSDRRRRDQLAAHAEILVCGEQAVDLEAALGELYSRDIEVVLCEGGPGLVAELLTAGLLDELCLTVAPLAGGDPLRLVGGASPPPLTGFELVHVLRHADELYLRYLVRGATRHG